MNFETPMNIDLQRSNAFPRNRRSLREREALSLQQFDGLPLSAGYARQRMLHGGPIVTAFSLILRFIAGKGFRQASNDRERATL